MKLSEKLDSCRNDSPDGCVMDEFARQAWHLEDALVDARSTLRYIQQTHGNLYGVGFERVEEKCLKALGD